MANLPAPFVIDAPSETNTAAGNRLCFNFLGFGIAAAEIPQIVAAFGELGEKGLRGESHRKIRFQLIEIRDLLAAGRSLVSLGNLGAPVVRDAAEIINQIMPSRAISDVVINFVTPTRIERASFQNPRRISSFHEFVLILSDRLAALWQLYGANWIGETNFLPWRSRLLAAADRIATKDLELRWEKVSTGSSTQQTKLDLSGFVGAAHFQGDLTAFLEMILLGELLHIGEKTVHGLGQYKVSFI